MIGVFGGTFDPVHYGHIELATALQKHIPFEEIRFIPCKAPVLKKQATTSSKDRLTMLKLALEGYQNFIVDEREINRETPSFMVETLHSLRKDYPKNTLCLILGMDAFNDLPKWHNWHEIMQLSHLIVMNRPNLDIIYKEPLSSFIEKHKTQNNKDLFFKTNGCLVFVKLSPIPISSKIIRAQIKLGHEENPFLSPKVLTYIKQHHLYL